MENFGSIGDVLDFAIKRENDSYDFYTRLAGLSKKPNIIRELQAFAEDELAHREKLELVKSGEHILLDGAIGSLGIAERVKDVEVTSDMTYDDLLVIGMKKERTAFLLYKELASKVGRGEIKDMLLQLAREEAHHALSLEFEYDLTTF